MNLNYEADADGRYYSLSFGMFVPHEVIARGRRLEVKYGRTNYVEDWCEYQYVKGIR